MASGGPLDTDWRDVLDGYKSANAAERNVVADDRLGRSYIGCRTGVRVSIRGS
jgi:hypothetical protein